MFVCSVRREARGVFQHSNRLRPFATTDKNLGVALHEVKATVKIVLVVIINEADTVRRDALADYFQSTDETFGWCMVRSFANRLRLRMAM